MNKNHNSDIIGDNSIVINNLDDLKTSFGERRDDYFDVGVWTRHGTCANRAILPLICY